MHKQCSNAATHCKEDVRHVHTDEYGVADDVQVDNITPAVEMQRV